MKATRDIDDVFIPLEGVELFMGGGQLREARGVLRYHILLLLLLLLQFSSLND